MRLKLLKNVQQPSSGSIYTVQKELKITSRAHTKKYKVRTTHPPKATTHHGCGLSKKSEVPTTHKNTHQRPFQKVRSAHNTFPKDEPKQQRITDAGFLKSLKYAQHIPKIRTKATTGYDLSKKSEVRTIHPRKTHQSSNTSRMCLSKKFEARTTHPQKYGAPLLITKLPSMYRVRFSD